MLPPFEPYSPVVGGAIATVTRHLAGELQERGHEIDVVAPSTPGDDPVYGDPAPELLSYKVAPPAHRPADRLLAVEARARRWSWPDYGRYRRQVGRALRRLRPEVVIAHNDPDLASSVGHEAPRGVLWLHNLLGAGPGRRLGALPANWRAVAVSEAVRRWTLERHALGAERISVIYNGVDLSAFRPALDREARSGELKVLCHGRLEPGKGYDVAVEAAARLRQEGLPVALSVAGPAQSFGVDEDDLRAYVEGLLDRLKEAGGRYLGTFDRQAMAHVVAAHDVGCAPSRAFEPFCLSALEAMACGCAVVATARGGLPEVVGDAGLLVAHDNPEALAGALRRLYLDPGLLRERQNACRTRSRAFSWSRAADALERLIRS